MADISIDGLGQRAAVFAPRNVAEATADARAHYECGVAWAQVGAYEQALEAWKQALPLTSDRAGIYAATGGVYMTLGCWQEAVRSYQKALLADPHLLECYYGLGSAYGRLGEYGRAIETYEQAFKIISLECDTEAVVEGFSGAVSVSPCLEPDALRGRLRSDTEGFDFSALLSSPAARRQAVRQEQASE